MGQAHLYHQQHYTEEVFKQLVRYIDLSVKVNRESIRENDAKEILGLSDSIFKASKHII